MSHKCDLDSVDTEGNSLLHLAILRGDTFAASFLIKSGCNTMLSRHSTQERPLHLVASYNPSRVCYSLSLVHREKRTSTCICPIHCSVTGVVIPLCEFMCSQALTTVSTASVQKAPWPSNSMVHIASQLLEFKADPNTQDCEGCTPLHRAVQCGNSEVFTVLLSNDR